jgi:peptide/nickel transport system substrate-binding protein
VAATRALPEGSSRTLRLVASARKKKVTGPRIVLDQGRYPRKLKEAPELAVLVREGKLPPVEERIGRDPLVIEPLHAVGSYGGTLRRASMGSGDFKNPYMFAGGPDSPLFWDPTGTTLIPNIARSFDVTDDDRVVRLHLRRGMRWSDGAPFIAEDFLFWYEDILLFRPLVPERIPVMQLSGKPVVLRQVDTYVVEFISPEPNALLAERMANGGQLSGLSVAVTFNPPGFGGYAPKHYLSKIHPKYISHAVAERLASDAGFDGWPAFFRARTDWTRNADLPVLTPWKTVKGGEIDKDPFVLERNPYSVWVDTEGHQLPYIGRIEHVSAADRDEVARRAAAGEYHYQDRYLEIADLPGLMEHQERGGYAVHLDPGQDADLGIRLNLAYDADHEVGELLRDVRFRRALSLAIDRDEINDRFFLGTATPSAALPGDDTRYFPGTEWRTRWATLDLAKANALLDEIGLQERDDEGYRIRRDGTGRLRLTYETTSGLNADLVAVGETIGRHWAAVGIDLVVIKVDASEWVRRTTTNLVQLTGNLVSSQDLFEFPDLVVPTVLRPSGLIGIPYAKWSLSGGRAGKEPFAELKALMELWQRGYTARGAERIRIGKEILMTHVDQVFSIGILAMGLSQYGIHLARNDLGNVPDRVVNSVSIRSLARPQTFYFKGSDRG